MHDRRAWSERPGAAELGEEPLAEQSESDAVLLRSASDILEQAVAERVRQRGPFEQRRAWRGIEQRMAARAEGEQQVLAHGRWFAVRVAVRSCMGGYGRRLWVGAAALTAVVLLPLLVSSLTSTAVLSVDVAGAERRQNTYVTSDAPALLSFSDDSRVRMAAQTELEVDIQGEHSAIVRLHRGRLVVDVAHELDTRWSFIAGPHEVQVVGTRFALEYSSRTRRLVLDMHDGEVRLVGPAAGEGTRPVVAGERIVWTASGTVASLEEVDGASVEARAVDARTLDLARPHGDVAPAVVAGRERSRAPHARATSQSARARSSGASQRTPSRVSTELAPVAASGTTRHGVAREDVVEKPSRRGRANDVPAGATKLWANWSEALRRGQYRQVYSEFVERGVNACLRTCSAGELQAAALAASYAGEPATAKRIWLAVQERFAGTSSAAVAPFHRARLAEREGQLVVADRLFAEYINSGARQYRGEALGRRLTIAANRGRRTEARRLARQYLESYPSGAYASAAAQLVEAAPE